MQTKWRHKGHEIELDPLFPLGPYYMIHGPHCDGGCGSVSAAKNMIDNSIKALTCKHSEERHIEQLRNKTARYCKRCHTFLGYLPTQPS